MTEVITIEDDEVPLHPAFFVANGESCGSVIFSLNGENVLACSQPIAKCGEGSVKYAEIFFKKINHKQICMICKQDFISTTLWTARSHFIHCHQMFCDFEELSKHNPKWIKSTIEAWEKAVSKSLIPNHLLKKRPLDNFITTEVKAGPSLKDNQALRRTFAIAISRGLFPFSFVNSPGNL
jgi:hypothetical protein